MREGITRRRWLLGAGAAVGALACGARSGPPRQIAAPAPATVAGATAERPVVIVGAGFSGLVIAYRLMQRGVPVRVLEASARAGGRIRTMRGFPDGTYVEAGALHIVAEPALVALLVELGMDSPPRPPRPALSTITYFGARVVTPAGQEPPDGVTFNARERGDGYRATMARYFAPADQLTPAMRRSMQWSRELAALDRVTCADYLRGLGASPGFLAEADNLLQLGDGVEQMSALDAMRVIAAIDEEQTWTVPGDHNGRIAGGTDQIVRALVGRLGDRVALSTVVERLEHDARGATLVIRDAQGRHRLDAARVVLTMPAPAMRAIDVAPGWSAAKARAIGELELTPVTRIWIASDHRYWLDRNEGGSAYTDLPTGTVRDETAMQPGPAAVLGTYAWGARGRTLGALDDAQRVAALVADVERVHPGIAGHLAHGTSLAWHNEPYLRGAYATFKPGQLTELAPALAAREGVVHFAGCGTSYRPGFLHGALSSATRVLDELARAE
jgi:monoamine oxidase